MNIHFTDKELFEKLKSATLAKVRVGSHLYGNNNENSDEDFLYIYATSEAELRSFVWTNHQLQYKEDGIDHNFVSLHTFVRNIINGDSTINFEVVHSQELKGTWLGFLYELRNTFNTYTITRSYNGFAKRDVKHFGKATTEYEKYKRLGHIIRGTTYADMLLRGEFDFEAANRHFIAAVRKFKEIGSDGLLAQNLLTYTARLDEQRKELNRRLDDGTLGMAKIMGVEDGMNLEVSMRLVQETKAFQHKQWLLRGFDMKVFINAFENWVSYE